MSEDIKDIEEILELAKEEIENNDENITATLDLQDLKSLKNLYNLYEKEKEKNKELQIKVKYYEDIMIKQNVEREFETLYKDLYRIVKTEYVSKDKLKELQQKVHNILDENGFTRAYQILVDKEFEKILGE